MSSTNEIHRLGKLDFRFKYSEFRKLIDYNYFFNPTLERQELQDKIIESYLENHSSYDNKWIIYTSGTYGSGKGHTLKFFDGSILNLKDFIIIDPDKIKNDLPECKLFSLENKNTASSRLHKESILISLIIEYIAIERGYAIIVDGSLKDFEWYTNHFKEIKLKNYNIAILKVNAHLETIKNRCVLRGEETGRIISEDLVIKIHKETEKSFDILKELSDLTIEIDNEHEPTIKSIKFNNSTTNKVLIDNK